MKLRSLALLIAAAAIPAANASFTYAIQDFHSSATVANGDRQFVSTKFAGSSYTMDQSNIGFFKDGTLNVSSHSYGWNDQIPGDFGGGNDFALNPDRGDNATHFAGESNHQKSGTLKEVFGQSNLGYLLDGEANVTWSLDLKYGSGGYITYDGNTSSPELMMLERGKNSAINVQAILEGGALSNTFYLDFHSGHGQVGNSDYSIDTTEISGAQSVGGIGLGLNAFNLSVGTKILGYRFSVSGQPGNTFDGPDFIGFVAGKTAPTPGAPVPEPASMIALGMGAAAMLRRRKKA
jgi:PEP-CTERM motif